MLQGSYELPDRFVDTVRPIALPLILIIFVKIKANIQFYFEKFLLKHE